MRAHRLLCGLAVAWLAAAAVAAPKAKPQRPIPAVRARGAHQHRRPAARSGFAREHAHAAWHAARRRLYVLGEDHGGVDHAAVAHEHDHRRGAEEARRALERRPAGRASTLSRSIRPFWRWRTNAGYSTAMVAGKSKFATLEQARHGDVCVRALARSGMGEQLHGRRATPSRSLRPTSRICCSFIFPKSTSRAWRGLGVASADRGDRRDGCGARQDSSRARPGGHTQFDSGDPDCGSRGRGIHARPDDARSRHIPGSSSGRA